MTIRGAGIYGGNVAGAGYPVPESPRAEPEAPRAEVRFTHRCRHCDMLIGRAPGIWNDTDGCVVCPGNPASLTAGHEPSCPPSEPVIVALPWFEVQLGETVLYCGAWMRLAAMWPATDDSQWLGISVFYGGSATNHQVRADGLVAVQRYLTEEG
jgi:hypothetical protein